MNARTFPAVLEDSPLLRIRHRSVWSVDHRGIMSKVEFRPLSRHHECAWCANDATQQAVQTQHTLTVISRCCDDPKCIWLSTQICERMTG